MKPMPYRLHIKGTLPNHGQDYFELFTIDNIKSIIFKIKPYKFIF